MGKVFVLLQGPASAGTVSPWGHIDARLGAPDAPLATTVRAALYTGRNPIGVTGGHRRGRPEGALEDFVREHSLFRAHGARYRSAHRPESFRQPPTPVMLAAEAAGLRVPTLGDLRRGEALAPDITGEGLQARGHHEVPLAPPREAAARAAAWAGGGELVVLEVERTTPSAVASAFLEALDEMSDWCALWLPEEGAGAWPDALPVAGRPRWELPRSVDELLPRWWQS
jgi:hypothetical protein